MEKDLSSQRDSRDRTAPARPLALQPTPMRDLRLSASILIVWCVAIALAVHLERGVNPAFVAGPLLLAALVLATGVPIWSRAPALLLALVAVAAAAAARFLFVEGALGDNPRSVVFELAAVGGTVLLLISFRNRLGRYERTLADAFAVAGSPRPMSFDEGQPYLYQEVRRARRYDRKLSVLSLAPAPESLDHDNELLVGDLWPALLERHAESRLAGILLGETNGCEIVTQRDNHFVILLPEADRHDAEELVGRLRSLVELRLGLQLQVGVSSFPDENITFDQLVASAEDEMATGLLRSEPDASVAPESVTKASARG